MLQWLHRMHVMPIAPSAHSTPPRRISRRRWLKEIPIPPFIVFSLFVGSPATAQIEFTRPVGYDVIVEQQVLTLEHVEEFRPENPAAKSWIVLVPDRKIEAKTDEDRRGLDALGRMAVLISGTYPRQSATSGLPPLFATVVRNFEQGARSMPPGVKMTVSASFENNPGLNERLAAQGYQVFNSNQATPPGQDPITFRFWVKADMSGAIKRGTASAKFYLVNRAAIDPKTSLFHGNFSVRQDSKLDIAEVPGIPEVREIAKQLYADFSSRAKRDLDAALATLNEPSQLLTPADLALLVRGGGGAEMRFNKKITITWFGEPRDVNLVIVARLGPLQMRDIIPAPDNNFSIVN